MAGRTNTRRMHKLRDEFFAEGKALDAAGDPDANCARCHQPIDYSVPPHTTDDSHNLGHIRSVEDFPELQEDPSNFQHEHRLCNLAAGAAVQTGGLGVPVPAWW